MSVTKLAAAYMYLVCESKVRCYKIPYGVPTHVLCGFGEDTLFWWPALAATIDGLS